MRAVQLTVLVVVCLCLLPAAQAQLPAGCAGLTPAQIEALTAPGVCDPGTHAALQANKDAQCNVPRSCKGTDDCPTLQSKKAQNESCLNARITINDTCFCGGNAVHRDTVQEARNAVENCNYFLAKKKCTDCP